MSITMEKSLKERCAAEAATSGVRIHAQSSYVSERSALHAQHYFFAYEITIKNERTQPVKVLRRFWQIMDGVGRLHVAQGEGVVGQQPTIAPGKTHKYRSFCPLTTPYGVMRGAYTIELEDGETLTADVPAFQLIYPGMLN